tara:strand:- start:1675 stop:2232 length:558 start_codon:yes stop_codon:yes gene_type:complete
MIRSQKKGSIEIICGPMFSGKTEELIRRLKRSIIAKKKILVFKPKLDNRYSDDCVVTHNKNSIESISIDDSEAKKILTLSKEINTIGIDEIQFFSNDIVSICIELAKNGKRVIASGLDKDYEGKPFGIIPNILCEAEYVTKLNAICNNCGDYAYFTKRISNNKKQILLGEKDIYEANCRSCFYNK